MSDINVTQPTPQVLRVSQPGHGSNVDIDATLTVSGAAADAKATGDALNAVKEDLQANSDRITDLENGGVIGGGAGWTSEQIDLLDQIGNEMIFASSEGGRLWDALIASLRQSAPSSPITFDTSTLTFSGFTSKPSWEVA